MRSLIDFIILRKKLFIIAVAAGGFLSLIPIMLLGGHELVEVVDSNAFCTQTCHDVHYPEAVTFKASPHSEVSCASCHVGSGAKNLVRSKLRGVEDIVPAITGSYQRPLPTPLEDRRPSSETCEKCHTPQKFTGDVVRTRTVYQTDESNTKRVNTVVLRVGGGTTNETDGIHWHVISKLWYLPLDEERLEIGWVGYEKDGALKQYIDPDEVASITEERIEREKRLMDCVDCHNRVTHIFRSSDELIDRALQDGSIDDGLPFVKREAMKAIGAPSPNLKEAYARAESLRDFYQNSYPGVYVEKRENVELAIDKLKEIARLTTFPDNMVDWNTHADQSGHNKPPDKLMTGLNIDFNDWRSNKSPGCFRCHGTLVPVGNNDSISNTAQLVNGLSVRTDEPKKSLDAKCNLCHYTATSELSSPIPRAVPHPTDKLEDCLRCHDQSGPKPYPKDHPWSTNEACVTCHKVTPGSSVFITRLASGSAKEIPHVKTGLEDCLLCHDKSAPKPFGSDHPWSTNDTCSACHNLASTLLPLPSSKPVASTPPVIHATRGLEDCLRCHGSSAAKPFRSGHPWSTNDTCNACHITPAATAPLPPSTPRLTPFIPHTTNGLSDCRLCHNQSGTRPFPADHSGIPNNFCTLCHQAAAVNPPASLPVVASPIPHTIQDRQDCLSCHALDGFQPALPADHSGRTNNICTSCHQPSAN